MNGDFGSSFQFRRFLFPLGLEFLECVLLGFFPYVETPPPTPPVPVSTYNKGDAYYFPGLYLETRISCPSYRFFSRLLSPTLLYQRLLSGLFFGFFWFFCWVWVVGFVGFFFWFFFFVVVWGGVVGCLLLVLVVGFFGFFFCCLGFVCVGVGVVLFWLDTFFATFCSLHFPP